MEGWVIPLPIDEKKKNECLSCVHVRVCEPGMKMEEARQMSKVMFILWIDRESDHV